MTSYMSMAFQIARSIFQKNVAKVGRNFQENFSLEVIVLRQGQIHFQTSSLRLTFKEKK